MGSPFDQLAKKIGRRALGASGFTAVEHEIPSNAHRADLLHEPDPDRQAERARLGLLGRLASVLCLIEFFSRAPGEERVIDGVGKLIAFRQERRREAGKGTRDPDDETDAMPAPFLWIITAGRPTSALSLLGAVPAEGWPRGVYISPGGPPHTGGMLRVGIVVASELPRDRSTILVRLMAGGAALPAALADLAALPAGAHEREIASMDVLELRQALGSKADRTVDEEEFVVGTQNIVEELRDEGRREGRDQGRREGRDEGRREGRVEARARDVLTVLRARGITVPEAARERVLAQKDPDRLERWLERAAVAASAGEVLDDPS